MHIMNLLLLDDHPIFRLGARQLIAQRWPAATLCEAGTLGEALALVRQQPFDIAAVDLNLPDSTGIEVVSRLRRVAPDMKILVLSFNTEVAYARRALELGASGYLAKNRAAEELVSALERIAAGGRYITAALAEQLADLLAGVRREMPHEGLSAQEYRVMIQLAEGGRVGDIATAMNLSPKTISTYRSRILEKLRLTSNAELALYCADHHLIGDRA